MGRPVANWTSHLKAAEEENFAFLTSRGGLTVEEACARLGITPEAYEIRTRRQRQLDEALDVPEVAS